jgi:hypothetical protein
MKQQEQNHHCLTNCKNEPEILPNARWVGWDNRDRLLIATHSGKLQVHSVSRQQRELLWEHDLNNLTPQPEPAPDWARIW